MVLQVMESATQATHAHTHTHSLAHRRMHTHIHPAESTPVLHMNDITVKFSGEVFFFFLAVGEDEVERSAMKGENISQITSRFSHPPGQTT